MEPLERLFARGLKVFCEGANVPTTRGALHRFEAAGILIGPVRAANSGGVAVSGLEQSQSSRRNAFDVRFGPQRIEFKIGSTRLVSPSADILNPASRGHLKSG